MVPRPPRAELELRVAAAQLQYELCEPLRYPSIRDFRATLRVTPVVDGSRAFVEWWATFDCPADELDRWTAQFTSSFGTWLASLRAAIAPPA